MLDRLRRALDRIGKLGTTLIGVALWEIGARVTLPGLNAGVLGNLFASGRGGLLGLYNMIGGGALSRGAILGLGLLPYLSARIYMRLSRMAFPEFQRVWEQPGGGARYRKWTRQLSVLLSVAQSIGFARVVQNIGAAPSGAGFVIETMLALTAGSVFVMLVWEHASGRLAADVPDDETVSEEEPASPATRPAE